MLYKIDFIRGKYASLRAKYPKLPEKLKAQQEEAVQHTLSSKDALCALPIGFGKSLIFIWPSFFMDEVRKI